MKFPENFEMVFNRRLIFGKNKIQEIPGILNWYNKKKVLFVTFSSQFSTYNELSELLKASGLEVVPYEVKQNHPYRPLTMAVISIWKKIVTVPSL